MKELCVSESTASRLSSHLCSPSVLEPHFQITLVHCVKCDCLGTENSCCSLESQISSIDIYRLLSIKQLPWFYFSNSPNVFKRWQAGGGAAGRESNGLARYVESKARIFSVIKAALFQPRKITVVTYAEHITWSWLCSEFLFEIVCKRHIFICR